MTEPSGEPLPVSEPVPYLRRSTEPRNNGRTVVIAAFLFFLLLVTFVVVLVVTIGVHNNGVKIPPGPQPHATQPS